MEWQCQLGFIRYLNFGLKSLPLLQVMKSKKYGEIIGDTTKEPRGIKLSHFYNGSESVEILLK